MEGILSSMKVSEDARRLSACVIGLEGRTGNLAHEAVSAMEIHLLQRGWPVGQTLGVMPDLQKVLGLGRPAYREAITILEARGLLNIRRGPGGGLFVAAPTADDVVGSMLMYLALSGASQDCINEYRLVVWRMIVAAAIDRAIELKGLPDRTEGGGVVIRLALAVGNPAMVLAARIAEGLVKISGGEAAPGADAALEDAVRVRDLPAALSRLEVLAKPEDLAAPAFALEAIEQGRPWSGRKSAMAVAARLIRELSAGEGGIEAEWETAERIGCTDLVVRQARRILQDFGIIRCRQGRKGAMWGAPASPAGVIRLLAPCFAAHGVGPSDNADASYFLACSAARLAAQCVSTRLDPPTASMAQAGDFVDVIRLENLVLELGGNPLLAITVRSLGLAHFLSDDAPLKLRHVDLTLLNQRILQAIESGDADAAEGLSRAKAPLMRSSPEPHRRVA